MRFLAFISLFALLGCASQPQESTARIEVINGNQLHYHGTIAPDNTQTVATLLASHADVDTLVISSGGGEVRSGMELGRLVHQRQLSVRVRGACLSSCANYVVTASPDVTVEANALLGWHGGALQPYYMSSGKGWMNRLKALFSDHEEKVFQLWLTQWQQQEADFFARVGTQQAVTILGMMPGLGEHRDAATFGYDIDTLHRLGLRIRFEDAQPATHHPDGNKLVQIFTLSEPRLAELLALNNATTEGNGETRE